ncbi:MAG: hypothetical protein MJE77_28695 [Proteobacteria bacterium]|nr:hypothetical protein [Pseudomonadota bacterium]
MLKSDSQAAEEAFLSLKARLDELPKDELTTVNLDAQKAASAMVAMGRKVLQPEMRSRFAKLPQDEFDIHNIDDLETAGLAAFHATVELLRASVHSTEARVPVTLIDQASLIKRRMLDLLGYHFGDDPDDGPEIRSIRQGRGYADLASDLLRLARLYGKHEGLIRRDIKNYVATDREEAQRLGREILALVGEDRDSTHRSWSLYVRRSLTLLMDIYGEVSAAGRWLYRHENAGSMFPSLHLLSRRRTGRQTEQPDTPDTADDIEIESPETD